MITEALTPQQELAVSDAHIRVLEETLTEVKAPAVKAELYGELASANLRRSALLPRVEQALAEEAAREEEAREEDAAAEEVGSAEGATALATFEDGDELVTVEVTELADAEADTEAIPVVNAPAAEEDAISAKEAQALLAAAEAVRSEESAEEEGAGGEQTEDAPAEASEEK